MQMSSFMPAHTPAGQPASPLFAKLEPLGFCADTVTAALHVLGETASQEAVIEYLLGEESEGSSTRSRAGDASSHSEEHVDIEVQLLEMGFSTAQVAAAQRAAPGGSLRDVTEYLLESPEPEPPVPRDAPPAGACITPSTASAARAGQQRVEGSERDRDKDRQKDRRQATDMYIQAQPLTLFCTLSKRR